MSVFVAGLTLCEKFFHEAVSPILSTHFPDLQVAAALIGSGSEVLGFDTAMSTDHHWGPRLMLFISPEHYDAQREVLDQTLAQYLPYSFMGYSTNFTAPIAEDNGVQLLEPINEGAVNHRVEIYTLDNYIAQYLGIALSDALNGTLTPVDWLTMTGQRLRTIIGGAVFQDDFGELTRLRETLAYYPDDIWRYLLAAGWARIGQEDPFVGRTGIVGDELGSRVIAARLVHDLMNLCFLMERQYAPYSKWFGTAFAHLKCAPRLTPIFESVFMAPVWQVREKHLNQASQIVAEMHNDLNLTDPLPTTVTYFHDRPFKVMNAEAFTAALIAPITDPAIKKIAEQTHIGSIEQVSTSTDVLSSVSITRKARALYE